MILDHAAPDVAAQRLEIVDALYRFGAGVDHNDADLLATAFSEDATVDFGPCGRAMGLDVPVLTGRHTILVFLCGNAEKQATSHAITNSRCVIRDGSAVLRTLVDATHLPRHDRSRCCRMMNWYHEA